jgi:hypothetical protein
MALVDFLVFRGSEQGGGRKERKGLIVRQAFFFSLTWTVVLEIQLGLACFWLGVRSKG